MLKIFGKIKRGSLEQTSFAFRAICPSLLPVIMNYVIIMSGVDKKSIIFGLVFDIGSWIVVSSRVLSMIVVKRFFLLK